MPINRALDTEKFKKFNLIANLKKTTQQARDRTFGYFEDYLGSQQEKIWEAAKNLGELLSCEEERNMLAKIHSAFFFTLIVREDEWPMLGYAEGIRSHIKNKILKDYAIDISNPENFPDEPSNWKKYTIKLTQEGKAFIKHKEEIPPDTFENVYMLLTNTQSALENRHNNNYVENYLSKIPTDLHDKLHHVVMLGTLLRLAL